MAENQSSTNSMGVCEKIHNAIALRRIRGTSHSPQNSKPAANNAPNLQLPATSEVIPIECDPPVLPTLPKEKEKTTKPHVSIQKNGQVAKVTPRIETGPNNASVKEDKIKPKAVITEPVKTAVGQGHVQVVRVAPNNEVVPTRVAALEKPKPKADIAPPEKAVVGSGHGQAKAVAGQGQQNVTKDEPRQVKGEEGKNSGPDDVNDKFSDYIDRAKMKITTTSNVGGGKSGSRLDSFHDKVSNFINRAKIKIRTTSNVGGGNSVSFK